MFDNLLNLIWQIPTGILLLAIIFTSGKTVSQGTAAVTEVFGKFRRVLRPGFNLTIPLFELVKKRISTQNKSLELDFHAVTVDQASVGFKAMLLYKASDEATETIKKIAYVFESDEDFDRALNRTIEGYIRTLVATKKQAEVLGIRSEIVEYVKQHVDATLSNWGYHLEDLQINDITFDKTILESMSRVVAAQNLKIAAENEGEADKIKKTKEAEGDKNAAIIRAEGVAASRQKLSESVKEMTPEIMQMMYLDKFCDTMRHMAENGKGKIIFMDAGGDGMKNLIANMQSMAGSNTKSA